MDCLSTITHRLRLGSRIWTQREPGDGAALANATARAWWQFFGLMIAVAVPVGALWALVTFFVAFHRCWVF